MIPRWKGGLLALLSCSMVPSACSSEPVEVGYQGELSIGMRKRRMLMGTELAIHRLLGQAETELGAILEAYDDELQGIATPIQLAVVHPQLESYGEGTRKQFKERVQGLHAATKERTEKVLAHYLAAMWSVAEEAGRAESGSDIGYRTGYRELDLKVESAYNQLLRNADVDGLDQLATFREADRIDLVRKVRDEIDGVGRVTLMISAPEHIRHFGPAASHGKSGVHEGVVEVIAFTADRGTEPPPMRFLQARRVHTM